MLNVSVSEARGTFTEILDRVHRGKERITVGDEGAPLAVLVPVEDLGLLESHGGPALPDGEQRFRDFAETASDWFWETDMEQRYTYYSGAGPGDELMGWDGTPDTRETIIGRTRAEAWGSFQDLQPDLIDIIADYMKRGEPFRDLEFSYRDPERGRVHVSMSGKPVIDDGGNAVAYRGTGRDITELKRAEEEARESRDRIRLIADNLPVSVTYFDTEQRFRFVNRTAREWYARPIEDILGRTIREIIGPEIHDRLSANLKGALSGEEQRFEKNRTFPDGKPRVVEMSYVPHFDDDGKVQGCFSLVQDITVRKRADEKIRTLNEDLERRVIERTEELRRSEMRLRDAMEALPVGFACYDGEDRLTLCNETYRGQVFHDRDSIPYGATFEEILKHKLARGHYPQAAGRESEWLAERLRVHNEIPGPIEQMHSSGRWYWISERRIGDGGTVVVSSDITERKQAEEELRTAQADLLRQARLATLGQLTATVSHELRNPLGVIRTSVFVVRDGLDEVPARVARSLERIERSVVRCDRIIDEMLDFTRISELEFETTPIDTWLAGVLGEQTVPREVTVHNEFGLPGVRVGLDRDRLRRAVINVFDNACQAMIADGSERSENGGHRLTVRTGAVAGRIELVFEDTGPGIPTEVLPRVFEPLFSTKGFGVGLGLSVVHQIMEQHGGGIEIENMAGGGARVRLWLPGDEPGT